MRRSFCQGPHEGRRRRQLNLARPAKDKAPPFKDAFQRFLQVRTSYFRGSGGGALRGKSRQRPRLLFFCAGPAGWMVFYRWYSLDGC